MQIERPSCCDEKTFRMWQQSARQTGHVSTFCVDCMPKHKAKMTVCGKCNNPDVRFRHDEDGFVEGFISKKPQKSLAEQKRLLSEAKKAHMDAVNKMRKEQRDLQAEITNAKVLAILSKGPTTAKDIADKTNVCKSTIYKCITRLAEKQQVLIDKVAGKPTIYQMRFA